MSASCSDDTALGMTIDVDFRDGEVNSFAASGSPTYDDSDGVKFTVSQSGDAPQLASLFYIMFGKVEITLKAAPGDGIVSSVVLQSDDLDEIDMEWLGAESGQMQSNYFGKGQTTTYNRGQFHDVANTQSEFITYTVDWTQDRIVWLVGGTAVRTLTYDDAADDQYPQTPMQVKFGAWSGGDSSNAAGTIKWAEGPTDYTKGPFTMAVQGVVITDYSTGSAYKYTNTSGSWQSIEAVDGEVNGNADGNSVTVTATATGTTATANVPVGIVKDDSSATSTQTGWPWVATASASTGAIPSGWTMNSEGKIVPISAAVSLSPCLLVLAPLLAGVAAFAGRLF